MVYKSFNFFRAIIFSLQNSISSFFYYDAPIVFLWKIYLEIYLEIYIAAEYVDLCEEEYNEDIYCGNSIIYLQLNDYKCNSYLLLINYL